VEAEDRDQRDSPQPVEAGDVGKRRRTIPFLHVFEASCRPTRRSRAAACRSREGHG
jgi:hypothetical protein